jgi:hypothetical protein
VEPPHPNPLPAGERGLGCGSCGVPALAARGAGGAVGLTVGFEARAWPIAPKGRVEGESRGVVGFARLGVTHHPWPRSLAAPRKRGAIFLLRGDGAPRAKAHNFVTRAPFTIAAGTFVCPIASPGKVL